MSAISSISSIIPVDASQAAQPPPPDTRAQNKPIEDTVHLSDAAQAAAKGGDADHDGA